MTFMESGTIELKTELASDICKEIVAFANSRGGTLYVGVADDRTVTGVKDAGAVMLRLNNMVQDSIKPDVTMFVRYETLEIEGKKGDSRHGSEGHRPALLCGGKRVKAQRRICTERYLCRPVYGHRDSQND